MKIKNESGVMDIQTTVTAAKMVIQSLIALLENENVAISPVKFQIESEVSGYESPKFELEKLIDIAIDGLKEIGKQGVLPTVPDGFVLVPREPTLDMMTNGLCVVATEIGKHDMQKEIRMIWQKMIEAREQVG